MNKVILMGNLTRDPEMKVLQSGTAVANFGMAMNERWTDSQTNEQRESVTFVEIEAWNRQAEVISEYLTKGSPILVEGSLKFEQWDHTDGTKRNRLKVRLNRFEFVGGNTDGNGNGNGQSRQATSQPATSQPATQTSSPAVMDENDDGIPF